jgi:catechol 2,3-dioxygenase-like lactoylglutathione lyase family enzyme
VRGALRACAVTVLAPGPTARPALSFLQLLLRSPNPPYSGGLLLCILDPADELVPGQRRDVLPGVERCRIREQRLTEVLGQFMHHPTGKALAAHPYIVMSPGISTAPATYATHQAVRRSEPRIGLICGVVQAPGIARALARRAVAYDLLLPRRREVPLPRTGFIDHVGIAVPDLVAAKEYYDGLMSVLGLREWFECGPGGPLNYGPDGAKGSQLFFYQAQEPGVHSLGQTGLHHLAFLVSSRAVVREVHQWAREREAIILDEPREFPQYGEHCFATYWLDPHGFKLEAVCHAPEES